MPIIIIPDVTCTPPQPIANAQILGNFFKFDDTIEVKCARSHLVSMRESEEVTFELQLPQNILFLVISWSSPYLSTASGILVCSVCSAILLYILMYIL